MTHVIQDGRPRPLDPPVIPWDDPAVQHGWAGFFETMRHEAGCVKRLGLHLRRLQASLNHWGLARPCPDEVLMEAIRAEVDPILNQSPLRVKIIAGEDPNSVSKPGSPLPARAWVDARPLEGDYARPLRDRGMVRLGVFTDYRFASHHPLAGFKSTQYGLYREARRRLQEHGWDEGILLNEKDEIVEACHFNVFWIAGGVLFTPDARTGCLPGVMAAEIAEIARDTGLKFERRCAPVDELLAADAVFLTNSVAEVIGVSAIENHSLPSGTDHPMISRLLDRISSA